MIELPDPYPEGPQVAPAIERLIELAELSERHADVLLAGTHGVGRLKRAADRAQPSNPRAGEGVAGDGGEQAAPAGAEDDLRCSGSGR